MGKIRLKITKIMLGFFDAAYTNGHKLRFILPMRETGEN
jgi:hypothetical protein